MRNIIFLIVIGLAFVFVSFTYATEDEVLSIIDEAASQYKTGDLLDYLSDKVIRFSYEGFMCY